MSYRLINSNELAIKYPEVNDMPCIYADLPNGLDGEHYNLRRCRYERCGMEINENTLKWFLVIFFIILTIDNYFFG